MSLYEISNIFLDVTAVISIPLYIRFIWVQLQTLLASKNDSLTVSFTILLLFTGIFDIFYTVVVDLIFIEIPGWGLFPDWYLENGNIKGKISMIGRTFNGAQHVFTILIFAFNRFSAIKLPFQYKYIWTIKNTVCLSIGLTIFLIIYHMPIILFCDFEALKDAYGQTGVRYYFAVNSSNWNTIYNNIALSGLSIITIFPSIVFYGIAGHYVYTHRSTFTGDSAKVSILKLTAASIVPALAHTIKMVLLVSQNVAWNVFKINLFPSLVFFFLLRLLISIGNYSLPWVIIVLFSDIRKKMFPWLKNNNVVIKIPNSVSTPAIIVNHN